MHASYNANDYVVHITEQRTPLEYAMGWKHEPIREAPPPKKRVYLGIAQIAIWPPLVRKFGNFVAQLFCRKWDNS